MAPTDLPRRASAPPQPPMHQQSSRTYHPSTTFSNPNPFISATRPRINSSSTEPTYPQTRIADRVRSMSASSLIAAPLAARASDTKNLNSMDDQLRKSMTSNEPAVEGGIQRGKNIFSWFQDTVVMSMLIRNWPG